ncbi:hypothetical protein CG50_05405 [Paenirhodobacter enshiensis]|uniref:Uncharacterized protein n=1 Tax=Paenirhodobacter enshiensis TaxID=1105367 RepID=A0A086XTT4_9RHOB|nr:hypothetical protein [Paenirhodobacter enshiensis]KFI25434.1 hypothetical protein CG50_05405 [Paenirhodobacter enshiensis]
MDTLAILASADRALHLGPAQDCSSPSQSRKHFALLLRREEKGEDNIHRRSVFGIESNRATKMQQQRNRRRRMINPCMGKRDGLPDRGRAERLAPKRPFKNPVSWQPCRIGRKRSGRMEQFPRVVTVHLQKDLIGIVYHEAPSSIVIPPEGLSISSETRPFFIWK